MTKIRFAKKVFILLAVLTFVSQSLSSHAFTHSNFSHEVSSSAEAHHNKTENLEMPSSHFHHDMHGSEHIVADGIIEIEGLHNTEHQCCEIDCDCDLAHCSTSLASQASLNSFFAMPIHAKVITQKNIFISIVNPPLIKPPITR